MAREINLGQNVTIVTREEVIATASGTNVLFQANAVSSLSETVLRVSFQVINNFGVATITAA